MVMLTTLSEEMAIQWYRELVIGGWSREQAIAGIRYLDRAKPLERRKACVRWALPYPVVRDPVEGLHDEDGKPIRVNQSKTEVFAARTIKQAAERAEKAAQRAAERAVERARKSWSRYDAGEQKFEPSMPRPEAMLMAA